jgi:murein L,D-transpeptidase YafK
VSIGALAVLRRILGAFLVLLAVSPACAAQSLKADHVVVLKQKRELRLMRGPKVLKSYPIALGFHPKGAKRWEGDGRTPEGTYRIDTRLAASRYHLALHISYPNAADQARAAARHLPPGGAIMIHGMPSWFGRDDLQFAADWTNGCIAVSNSAIEEIWQAVDDGTAIEIRP